MKTIRLITLFVLLLAFTYAKGQDRIITTQNDTIFCRIIYVSAARIAYVQNEQKGETEKPIGKFILKEQVKSYFQGGSVSSETSRSVLNSKQSLPDSRENTPTSTRSTVDTGQTAFSDEKPTTFEPNQSLFYLGAGVGFDYGGLGGKIELLPVKYVGFFAGAGFNLLSVGWNVGGTYKILPDRKVSPNLMFMYGYNAVFVGADAYSKQYNMTSYGITVGANVDIRFGKNKLSAGLFIPFRSSKFKEKLKNAENDPNLNLTPLLPVQISVGFNFGL